MKKIIIFLLISFNLFGQGVKLTQIEPYKIGGVAQDSGFIMTMTNGYQKYIPIDSLISIINRYYDLCNELNKFDEAALDTSEYIFTSGCKKVKLSSVTDGEGFQCYRVFECITSNCDSIADCVTNIINCEYIDSCIDSRGDTCYIVNKVNGSYDLINENNTAFNFGYKFFCKNDSTIVLTDQDGTRIDSCTILGRPQSDPFTCEDVEACLDSFDFDGKICQAFGAFPGRAKLTGDSIIVRNGGSCARVPFPTAFTCTDVLNCLEDSIDLGELICLAFGSFAGKAHESDDSVIVQNGGTCFKVPFPLSNGANIHVQDSDCIDLILVNDSTISARIEISADAGNNIECRANGLYGASNCEEFATAPAANLQEGHYIYANIDGTNTGCRKIAWNLTDDNCVRLAMDMGNLRATINISADAGNTLQCRANGLYASGGYTLKCDTVAALFTTSAYATSDKVYGSSGTDCEKYDLGDAMCTELNALTNGGTLQNNDRVIVAQGGSCAYKTFQAAQDACPSNTTTSYTYVIVQDGDGACFRITCANFKLYLNGGSCN